MLSAAHLHSYSSGRGTCQIAHDMIIQETSCILISTSAKLCKAWREALWEPPPHTNITYGLSHLVTLTHFLAIPKVDLILEMLFLWVSAAAAAVTSTSFVIATSTSSTFDARVPTATPVPGNYSGLLRPQIHFSPPQKFMNDPNGLFRDLNGTWHLYYQCKIFVHLNLIYLTHHKMTQPILWRATNTGAMQLQRTFTIGKIKRLLFSQEALMSRFSLALQ